MIYFSGVMNSLFSVYGILSSTFYMVYFTLDNKISGTTYISHD